MLTSETIDPKGNRFYLVTEEPSAEPVTVDELKDWARIDGSDEDTVIEGIIKTARQFTEKFLGRSLIKQKIEMVMDEWNCRDMELPYSPIISIDSVVTIDEDDAETTYSSDNYYLINSSEPGRVAIKDNTEVPTNTDRLSAGIKITYYAGYGTTATEVPQAIREAIKLWATEIYENRNPNPDPPDIVARILSPYIIFNA